MGKEGCQPFWTSADTSSIKEESGGEKERDTAGMAGRNDVLPSSGFFDGGRGRAV